MSSGLDTSVVLRLITGEPEAQALRALRELERILGQGGAVYVSDLVISEAYFALQHHYGVPKKEALSVISRFLVDSGVDALGAAPEVLATPGLATAKPGFVDRLIHAEYMRSVKEILTFERGGARLRAVRVLQAESPATHS
ncbi:MAG: PIN domain-containing protein [Kiritimatiellae bacterium]|nr:PIN domain-containing protein [Kiritimatiellia bacterium]